jgi:hypothetical protein
MADTGFTPGEVNVYVWVDKTQYKPGETITLYYTILNAQTSDIVLKEIRVETPWFMYINDHWEGNQTIRINEVLKKDGQTYHGSTTLAIPNDGRAFSSNSSAKITVKVDFDGAPDRILTINIGTVNPPFAVRDMDTLVLLAAVLIILMVVCTALIAAAIFLSARKPQETYPESPKTS